MEANKYERDYVFTRKTSAGSVDEMVETVTALLQKEGFGVLTQIDVKATLKKKLDVDRRPYRILGACNPPFANDAITAEPSIGVFLPCNVTVFEGDDAAVYVQTIRPLKVFGAIDNKDMEPIARNIEEKLKRVIDQLN